MTVRWGRGICCCSSCSGRHGYCDTSTLSVFFWRGFGVSVTAAVAWAKMVVTCLCFQSNAAMNCTALTCAVASIAHSRDAVVDTCSAPVSAQHIGIRR